MLGVAGPTKGGPTRMGWMRVDADAFLADGRGYGHGGTSLVVQDASEPVGWAVGRVSDPRSKPEEKC